MLVMIVNVAYLLMELKISIMKNLVQAFTKEQFLGLIMNWAKF